MIGAVRSWLTSIAAVTLMLTVVQTLVPEGRLRLDFSGYEEAIEARTAELDNAGKEELAAIIAGRTAAYISDKADALGLDVEARVETEPGADGETPLPARAELRGPYSQDLADWIAGELGIPAERQVWHEGKN